MNIRNICIIAHVDHGKTTLVDHLLKSTFQSHESVDERVMDSDAQEKERGITISAKNASFMIGETKVNIVDTPGHADFGGEVERIMDMVDGAILLVDAAEGPLPQTRFVLEKAIRKKLKIILCINKVDRPEVQDSDLINQCVNKAFDLFVELQASDDQCDFPIVYACARQGWCTQSLDALPQLLANPPQVGGLEPLSRLILDLPKPPVLDNTAFSFMISNLAYSDFLGALAIGRIYSGSLKTGQFIYRHGVNEKGQPIKEKFFVQKLMSYSGIRQVEVPELFAGDIGIIAGSDNFAIGDTIAEESAHVHDRIEVEKPTMRMIFSINTSPKSGTDGKAIQSRELRERLEKEVRNNVALALQEADTSDQYYLQGRGELQFGIIIEKLRREGLEFMVGRPTVLIQNGQEPYERVTLNVPEESAGDVTSFFQQRKGQMVSYESSPQGNRVQIIFEIPTRGYIGTNSKFKTLTRGEGLISSESMGYGEFQGDIFVRQNGALIADRSGKATAYALSSIQERGLLFIDEGEEVYEGMVIGECAKDQDLNVNPCKPKKLTNVRSVSSDGITILAGIRRMSLEKCIEWLDDDEWIEVTPKTIRIRKKILTANMRGLKKS
jgi:GTP-binding protein